MPVLRIKGLFHSFRDVLLEVVDLGFLGAESAPFPGPRGGAFLGLFTDGPILAVGVEAPIALGRRVRRTPGPESVDHEIVRMLTEEHVWEHEIGVASARDLSDRA